MTRMAKRELDFLDEMIAEDTAADPAFPALLAAAEARRRLLRELVAKREAKGRPHRDSGPGSGLP